MDSNLRVFFFLAEVSSFNQSSSLFGVLNDVKITAIEPAVDVIRSPYLSLKWQFINCLCWNVINNHKLLPVHAWVQLATCCSSSSFFLFAMHVRIYRIMASKRAIQRKQTLIRSIRSMCSRKGNRKFPRWPEIINHNLERDAAANGISQFSAVLLASSHTAHRIHDWKHGRDGCGARWRRNWILVSYTHDMRAQHTTWPKMPRNM